MISRNPKRNDTTRAPALACAGILLCVSHGALAQAQVQPPVPAQPASAAPQDTGTSAGLEDIVVTAQRRSERLQDVPIAVAAVTATQLGASGVASVTDLRVSVTGLTVQDHGGYAAPRVRGVGASTFGPGIENSVATYVDGVYLASAQQSLMSFNNIAQIEVLKGPQGTLFGRNATGGLIQIFTRDPGQTPSGSFSVGYGNFETVTASGYYSTPLTDNLASDLAVSYTHQGEGWGKNTFLGDDIYRTKYDLAIRSKTIWRPTDTTKITVIGDYSRKYTTAFPFTLLPGTISPFEPAAGPQYVKGWDQRSDIRQFNKGSGGGVSGKIDQEIGDLTLTSITAYRKSRYRAVVDVDGTAFAGQFGDQVDRERQFSQELQLSSSSRGPFKWVAGAFYFNARGQFAPSRVGLPVAGIDVVGNRDSQYTRALSAYGQGTYEFLPDTNLTLGVRYNTERRRLAGDLNLYLYNTTIPIAPTSSVDVKKTFDKVTFRAALDHKITPDLMVYASFNRGFKSGGYNAAAINDAPFKPEVLDAFEAGFKSELFDRRLRLNVSGFYYDYKDVQVQIVKTGAPGIANAESARIYGVDVDVEASLTNRLKVSGGIEWLDPKFKNYPNAPTGLPSGGVPLVLMSASGNQLPVASKFVANSSIDYKLPLTNGSVDFNATGYYTSGWYPDPDNIIRQPRFAQINALVTWETTSGFSLSAWGKNLTNIRTQGFSGTTPEGAQLVAWAAPRTYGVTAGYKF